jgi:hypothetical protein
VHVLTPNRDVYSVIAVAQRIARAGPSKIAAGVPLVDMANEIAWYPRAGWGIRFPSEMKVLAFTRPVLDLPELSYFVNPV